MFDETVLWNALKFAILLEYENPNNEKTKTILHYSLTSINLFFVKSVYILKVP